MHFVFVHHFINGGYSRDIKEKMNKNFFVSFSFRPLAAKQSGLPV